ncbi:ferric reductase-like transmembrane domain-containing protein [bacterium]|nr:ferric reductase-like transmembrane domain-containing protein [bacterium]
MRRIRIALWGLLAGLSVLWAIAYLPVIGFLTAHLGRSLFLQYTGVLAFGMMSVAMILALRSVWLDRWLNGLDKMYRLHKWLGIGALITAVTHWGTVKAPHFASLVGLTERPPRPEGGRPGQGGSGGQRGPGNGQHEEPFAEIFGTNADPSAVETFLSNHHNTALHLGEWAFYGAVVLIAIALITRIPYWLFAKTHTLIAVAYLMLTFHAMALMTYATWTSPIGVVMGLLMVSGVSVAILTLTRQIGRGQKVAGTVQRLRQFPTMNVTETEIELRDGWPGHSAGQFAFVTFDKAEGAHPFTIASAWDKTTRSILFISKALGDYTRDLPKAVEVGHDVVVEGPYGQFTFDDDKTNQIWIGAGIGITPFIARLKQLADQPDGKQIDLFHCVPTLAPEPQKLLEADVAAAGAKLHLVLNDHDAKLSGERLRELVPDWSKASIWFCGPAGFGAALRKDLTAHGLNPNDFHQEAFNMR